MRKNHNAAAAAQNINAAYGDCSANELTIQHWYAFKSGDESLTNDDRCRQETDVLRVIVAQNTSNTVRDYAEKIEKPAYSSFYKLYNNFKNGHILVLFRFASAECDEEDVDTWMACNAEECGFQMLNDDNIVTSVQEESDPVDDEPDEDEIE
ncbi:hypothetical protein TNCV_2837591 [Trichonephila clavipes]|nr:hypothetical protein TNCV_2837591 [Trichonephila clavipes]